MHEISETPYSAEIVPDRNGESQASFPSISIWLRDHLYLASIFILIASLVPRLLLTLAADPHGLVTLDSGTYFTPAMNLLLQGAFLDEKQMPEVARTPGYPVFLLGIMAVTGKSLTYEGLGTILTVQTIILSFSVVLLYWLARRILPPAMAFTGSLLAAFSPWGAVAAGLAMTEGLFVFLLALLLLVMKLVEETTSVKHAVWGSVALGLLTASAVLVRPIWPLVILIAGALFLRYGPARKGAWIVLTVMLITAATPLFLWKARNIQEANFQGLSDISGKTIWRGLASRVKAEVNGEDRFVLEGVAIREDTSWSLSVQEADQERWRRSIAIFREHPVLTVYSYGRSVAEHMVHPSPLLVLTPAKLNFYGDYWVLAILWAAFLTLACLGWWSASDIDRDYGTINRSWLMTILVICLLLTLASGMAFGAGSRYRAPLELVVPLLAGIGLVRLYQYWARSPRP
jgi:hypothetical protein